MRRIKFHSVLLVGTAMTTSLTSLAFAGPVDYTKQIYFNNDAANAAAAARQPIRLGASLNTYFFNKVQFGGTTLNLKFGGKTINYNVPAGTLLSAPMPTLVPEPGKVLMYGGNPYPFPFPQEGSLNKVVQGNNRGAGQRCYRFRAGERRLH